MKYIPSIPIVKTRFGFPLLPKILSTLLLFLGVGLLRAETTWDVYADFNGKLNGHWPYGQGDGEVTKEGGRFRFDTTQGGAARTSVERFDQRSIRFLDFREEAGHCWSFGLGSYDGKDTIWLSHDSPTSQSLFFSVGNNGKVLLNQDLGPLPAGSSLDLSLDWIGDHYVAEVKRNGAVILQKTLSPSDVRKVSLYAHFNGYAGAIFSLKEIDASPEPDRGKLPRPFHQILGMQPMPVGYFPSPWAKSSVPATLEALRKLRPANLPTHPLAMWVADRLARDTGKSPDKAAVEAGLHAFKKQGDFWVRDDESGFWLSNGKSGFALLPASQGAAIASLYNMETGTECIFHAPKPSVPWKLRLWKNWPAGQPAPISGIYPNAGKDMSYFLATDCSPVEAHWNPQFNGSTASLNIQWQPAEVAKGGDQYALSATIAMDADSPLIRWRASANRTAGTFDTLIALQFPVVQSLSAPKESDLMMAWGQGPGHMYRKLESWTNDVLTYPHGGIGIPFFNLSLGPDASLYLAAYDGEANCKQAGIMPKGSTFIETTASQPDKMEMNYDVVMAPIKGDWYDAARLYRQWALQQKWCAKGSLWERAQKGTVDKALVEVDYWIRPNWPASANSNPVGSMVWWPTWLKDEDAPKDGPEEVWANVDWFWHGKLPRFTQNAANEKIAPSEPPQKPKLGIWWYMWEKQGFDAETPVFDARPGVPEEWKKEVDAGLVLTPYIDIQFWDTEEPTWDAAAKAAACKAINGKFGIANWAAPLAAMCTSTSLFGDTMASVIQNVHTLGSNGIYLDTMPSAGFDWDPSHGHTPGPGGHWDTDNQRRDLERVKKEQGEQFGITMEQKSEPLMDCEDVELSYETPDPDNAPLWPSIYGGYTVISGATVHSKGPDDPVSFRLKMGRSFLWGNQLGRGVFSGPLLEMDKAIFIRKIVRLRAQAHKFMPYGEMLRPPQLLGDIPRVHASKWVHDQVGMVVDYDAYEAALWQAPDGDLGLVFVNFDNKPHTVAFPAKQVFAEDSRGSSLITSEGEKPWRTVNGSETVSLKLPPADAAMIVFKK